MGRRTHVGQTAGGDHRGRGKGGRAATYVGHRGGGELVHHPIDGGHVLPRVFALLGGIQVLGLGRQQLHTTKVVLIAVRGQG